jgi:hypothetical protein
VLRADAIAVKMGARTGVVGAEAVARGASGRAQGARLALIDGVVGAVWAPKGKPRVVLAFTIAGEKIAAIELTADPVRLAAIDLVVLES